LAACVEHTEQGRALYDPEAHRTHRFLYGGHDPGVCGCNHGAMALWLLGYPGRAVERAQESQRLARSLGHGFTLANAFKISAFVHQFRRDVASTQRCAEGVVAICTEKAVAPHLLGAGRIMQGWAATVDRRRAGEGLAEIRAGLERLDATGVQLRRPYYLTLLADACARAGSVAEGLAVVARALRGVERWWEAETHRVRGELLLAQSAGNRGEGEACFARALEIARRQGARSLELRAATSLARLWGEDRRRGEARDLLAPVYGWFGEGFDTPDLRDARALLDELG
jgi:predicted ATPase